MDVGECECVGYVGELEPIAPEVVLASALAVHQGPVVEDLAGRDAVEMYYNAAITPWLNMALDLQVVDSGYNKTLSSSGRLRWL